MFQLAIVDDEEIIRRGLQRVVDWEELGFAVSGAYQSTEALLESLEVAQARDGTSDAHEGTPDAILVDIRLPRASGLDLIRRVRHINPTARFVILSGYDSFQYAQSAIDLGVFAYLLKPVKRDEIEEVFGRLAEELRRDRQNIARDQGAQTRFVELVAAVESPTAWDSYWDEVCKRSEWLRKSGWFLALVDVHAAVQPVEHTSIVRSAESAKWSIFAGAEKLVESTGVRTLGRDGSGRLLFAINSQRTIAAFEQALNRAIGDYRHEAMTVAFSASVARVDDTGRVGLQRAFATAERRILARLTMGINQVIVEEAGVESAESFSQYISPIAGRCANSFLQTDETGVAEALRNLISVLREGHVADTDRVNYCLVLFFERMNDQMGHYGVTLESCDVSVEALLGSLFAIPDLEMIYSQLESILLRAVDQYRRTSERPHNYVVSAALEIISRRFGTDLTLERVAEEVQVSPSHLSRLFRHVLNETFKEHLTAVRIADAKRRLLESNDRVYEIAAAVGFPDQRYFSELFRKQTGSTPVQFRNRRGNEM